MPNWKKIITSGSDAVLNTVNASSFTGSFLGTGSYALQALSASYAATASYALNAGDSVWTGSSGDIYYNGGDVGIGTTSPANKLHIYGADGLSYIRWTSDVATTGTRIGYNGTEFRIDQQQNADIALRTNGSERMRITSAGNVGIGSINPQDYTSVNASNLVIGNATGNNGMTITSGTTGFGALAFADGTAALDQYRGLIQYGHTANSMNFFTNSVERMRIDSSGNVGIGTTSPTYQLHVSSSTAALGVYERAGGAALYLEGQLTKGVVGTVGTHPLVIAYNSGEVARFTGTSFDITGSLNVGGTTTVSGSIIVQDGSMGIVSTGTTNATEAFKVQNATPEDMLVVKDDGELQISTGKYSNDGVLTNNGGIVTEIVGWSGTININQPAPDPPIQIQVDKGIIVNVT